MKKEKLILLHDNIFPFVKNATKLWIRMKKFFYMQHIHAHISFQTVLLLASVYFVVEDTEKFLQEFIESKLKFIFYNGIHDLREIWLKSYKTKKNILIVS